MSDPVVDLFAGTVTSSGNSGSPLIVPTSEGIGMVVYVTAVSGTLPTLALTLQHSQEGTVFFDVPNGGGIFTLAGLGAPGNFVLYFPIGQCLFDFCRLRWVVAGIGASFTFEAHLGTRTGI